MRGITSTSQIHRTERSQVDLGKLFGLRAFSSDAGLRDDLDGRPATIGHDEEHREENHDDHEGGQHNHVHFDISSILIPLPNFSSIQFDKLNSFLESLLWEGKLPPSSTLPPPEILRTKGYIKLEDGRSYILQGVTDLFELTELPRNVSWTQDERQGKLVFIGRGVDAGLSMSVRAYVGIAL